MTVIDTMRVKERMYQLCYSEFIYFLCKIIEVHFTNTNYENEDFYVKLDNMLPDLLEPFELRPQFRFRAKFASDQQTEEQDEVIEFGASATPNADIEEVKASPIDTENGEIQAWPQPCPIAYPHRAEMIKSPSESTNALTPIASIPSSA